MSRTEAAPARRRRGGLIGFLRDLVVILVIAFLISFLLKTFLVRSFWIPSPSMVATLEVNDRILVNQLVPKLVAVKHGDVVVFRDPGGWLTLAPSVNTAPPTPFQKFLQVVGLTADTSSDYVVKRVIGLGGDEVACCDANGRVTVNGVPLDEPYINVQPGQAASGTPFDVTVPEGYLWMMGDNRYDSADSRAHQNEPGGGFVPESDVVGRAFLLNWPLSRFGWLSDYPDTFTGVSQAQKTHAGG